MKGGRDVVTRLLCEAVWQRCYVHFLRSALDHLPRRAEDDCLTELRWLYSSTESGGGSLRPEFMVGQVGKEVSEAVLMGGGEQRAVLEFLPLAAPVSQIDQHVGAAQ